MFVLLVHQALYFQEMNNCLLCPMQLRLNDAVINERPKFLTAAPTEKDHAITADGLLIPLDLHGVTLFFHGRRPTMAEYKSCKRIELTYPDPIWRPQDPSYADEEALRNSAEDGVRIMAIHDEESFATDIYEQFGISAMKSDNPKYKLTPEVLATTWGIGLTIAKKTLEATTQRAVKTVANPSVERRWPTGDRPLRYRKLHHQLFHDNMKAQVKSLRGNTCCEIYATDFGW